MSKMKMYVVDGQFIKRLIKERGLTETSVSEKSDYTLRRINGALRNNRVSISMLDDIARVLDVRPDILLAGRMPESTGDDPISQQLHKDLVSYNSRFNLDSQNDIEYCIKKLCLACGLDYDFVSSLSENEIETLKENIFKAIRDFDFLYHIEWS